MITESPRRRRWGYSRNTSPGRLPNLTSSLSQLATSFDNELDPKRDLLDEVPEKDWRLLANIARKREEREVREQLAEQFRRLWDAEKKERRMVEEETSYQYRRYLKEKREQERVCQEFRKLQLNVEQEVKRELLMDGIMNKQRRSEGLMAWYHDKKTSDILEKALEYQARILQASDRRLRMDEAQKWRKNIELVDAERKVDEARRRRHAMLRNASQRVAISNALSSWESSLLQQEATAMDRARRAHHAARVAMDNARSARLARARDYRQRRARQMAQFTSQLRESVRLGFGNFSGKL